MDHPDQEKIPFGLLFSKEINYQFVDSGSIYRSGTYLINQNNIDINDDKACAKVFKDMNIKYESYLDLGELKQKVIVNDADITLNLSSELIAKLTSLIATKSMVRERVKDKQMEIVSKHPTVMSGRDIGTLVFPDAKLKFFITADPKVRATRRLLQYCQEHPNFENSKEEYEKILDGIIKRDNADTNRTLAPLKKADDAYLIKNDNTIKDTLETMSKIYNDVIGKVS